MILHYLKIALRNLTKFRLQTIVCLTGLAVGMTCFSLGTLWLRYIDSFESFFPDAGNVYFVTGGNNTSGHGFRYDTYRETGKDLLDSVPAVTDFCTIARSPLGQEMGGVTVAAESGRQQRLQVMMADSAFFPFFGVKAEAGSLKGFGPGDVILTRSAARALIGDTIALGQKVLVAHSQGAALPSEADGTLTDGNSQTMMVRAIVPDCPRNSQFRYEALVHLSDESQGDFNANCLTFVRLNPRADLDSLVGVPFGLTVATPLRDMPTMARIRHHELLLSPVTKLRADYPTEDVEIGTEYVRWFMLLGALVILCSVFNYIITMVSHLRRRGWEFSLRRVLGSSRANILFMVSLEALIIFLLSAVLAGLLTWLVLPYFYEYSGIDLPLSAVALRLAAYLAFVIVASMMASALTAWLVMHRTQRNVLSSRQALPPSGGLRGAGPCLQMALAMGIIFALSVMLRQIDYLMFSPELGFTHTDIGVARKASEELNARLRQSPLVEEMADSTYTVFPRFIKGENGIRRTEDRSAPHINNETVWMDSTVARIYGFQLVTGELPVAKRYFHLGKVSHEMTGICFKDGVPEYIYQDFTRYPIEVCINEAMCRALGVTPDSAVGLNLYNVNECRVSGVVKDMYTQGPIIQPQPTLYYNRRDDNVYPPHSDWRGTVFRARHGHLRELCDSVKAWNEAIEGEAEIYNCDADFEQFLRSEQMLIKILLAVGGASLFVCVIGTFSLVSLALQRRRKEIAIRKVHGAKLKDILRLFLRSHVLSLFLAALVAYPLAYIIMKHWLEGYAKQVGIDWWLIPLTFLAIASVVLGTITLKIWRAVKESTAEALNS